MYFLTAVWYNNDAVVLEQEGSHASHFALFFDEYLKVLVDDGDGEEDTGAGADGAHEIGADGEGADAEAAERRRRRDVPVQLVDHRNFSVTPHHHLLFAKLLGDLRNNNSIMLYPKFSLKEYGSFCF